MSVVLSNLRIEARRIEVRGIVQGVGFRPLVLRLASGIGLAGVVRNEGTCVVIEVVGQGPELQRFEAGLQALQTQSRGGLRVDSLVSHTIDPPADVGKGFSISPSTAAQPGLGVAPDWATCAACLAETLDPFSRRYRYPFTACTDCGPRLSVFQHPPYDRVNTTMAAFPLCAECAQEYGRSADRRFHAQATACHACGPKAKLSRLDGRSEEHTV